MCQNKSSPFKIFPSHTLLQWGIGTDGITEHLATSQAFSHWTPEISTYLLLSYNCPGYLPTSKCPPGTKLPSLTMVLIEQMNSHNSPLFQIPTGWTTFPSALENSNWTFPSMFVSLWFLPLRFPCLQRVRVLLPPPSESNGSTYTLYLWLIMMSYWWNVTVKMLLFPWELNWILGKDENWQVT